MTISVFNLTENTQLSVRCNTGYHPDGLSLGIFTETKDSMMEMTSYDATDWETAVKMAKWILKIDEEYNGRD